MAELLRAEGFGDDIQAAALLHDVLECSDLRAQDIDAMFGPKVGAIVSALTEDARLADYRERKAEHRRRVAGSGRNAAAVFAADKLANARALRAALVADDGALERLRTSVEDRLWHYEETLQLLQQVQPGLPLLDALERELRTLREDLAPRRN